MCGEFGGGYTTLMESDVVEPSGRGEGGTRPGRTHQKPIALSACESEERGCGRVGVDMLMKLFIIKR